MATAIRLARPADLEQLLTLYRLLDAESEPTVSIEVARYRLRRLESNPLQRLYVAERESRLVGTFSMIFVPGISHGARDSCVIEDVVVDTQVQGSGIGRQMMRFAMAQCAMQDCYKLTLSSHVNRERAHRFYEGLGFRRHGYSFLIELGERS
jgi:ribosomal protein S18 acetylase RimI-like enzyme